jgi:hypothetical protein
MKMAGMPAGGVSLLFNTIGKYERTCSIKKANTGASRQRSLFNQNMGKVRGLIEVKYGNCVEKEGKLNYSG